MTTDFTDVCDTERLDELGTQLYGEQWPNVRAHNIKRLKGDDPAPLGYDEMPTFDQWPIKAKGGTAQWVTV